MILALFAVGCENAIVGRDDDEPIGSPEGEPDGPQPSISLEAARGFDPLRAPLAAQVSGPVSADAVLEIVEAAREFEVTLDDEGRASVSWDGRGADGEWVEPGAYTLRFTADDLTTEAETVVFRSGFLSAWLEDDAGVTATREALYWPGDAVLAEADAPVAALSALDDGEAALDFPRWDASEIVFRPEDAEPAAFVFDSRPILRLEAPSGTAVDLVDVDVAAAGWTVVSGSPLREGVPVVLQLDAPLGDTVGVTEVDVALSLSLDGEALGAQVLPLTVYRLMNVSGFERDAPKYRPWVPIVDEALRDLEGTPADEVSVTNALADFVYHDLGLVYDTQSGAAVYSVYLGFDLSEPHFLISDFLPRRFGDVINCSDAGNILGAYANMVGVPLDHLILDPSFDLNYIQAIGQPDFVTCPFGPGGCGFSYHAVTTIPGSGAIWDATLALDGDSDPGSPPHVVQLVHEIPAADYEDALVRSGNPAYNNQSQETLE